MMDGKMVIIQGQVPGHAKRFAVNFQCGNPKSDIAFHFNVRYDESTVVCNTLEHGKWGTEERKPHIPINPGSYFELIIKAQYYCFQVSANGVHFMEYSHRLPLVRVDNLNISGDVHVNSITFTTPNEQFQFSSSPAFCAPVKPAKNIVFNVGASQSFTNRRNRCKSAPTQVTVNNPNVPYQAYVGNIRPNQLIKVIGTVKAKPNRFAINLKTGYSDNIALHINPRFDENAVVRNSKINQGWGQEERNLPFLPFVPGQTFEMQILVQPNCYKVTVNGRHLFNYNHRIQPLNQIDMLEVTGDVSLSLVQY
ncbi:galectin-9-like isoform X2 [Narcine bancroftii]|uniref:galectin-9-like isoform X2 n=1 Tax=Narcine bancroftii TaxID=1343680 RepID=UPI003831F279